MRIFRSTSSSIRHSLTSGWNRWSRHAKNKLLPSILITITALTNTGCFTAFSHFSIDGSHRPSGGELAAAVAMDIVTSPVQIVIFLGAMPILIFKEIEKVGEKVAQQAEIEWWTPVFKSDASLVDRGVARQHLRYPQTIEFIDKQLEQYCKTAPDFDLNSLLFLLDDLEFSLEEFHPLPEEITRRIYERVLCYDEWMRNAGTPLNVENMDKHQKLLKRKPALMKNPSTPPDILREMSEKNTGIYWAELFSQNPSLPSDVILKIAGEADIALTDIKPFNCERGYEILLRFAGNSKTPQEVLLKMSTNEELWKISRSKNFIFFQILLGNKKLPLEAYLNICRQFKEERSKLHSHQSNFVIIELIFNGIITRENTPQEVLIEICD